MKDRVKAIMDKLAPPECGIEFAYYGTSPTEICTRPHGHSGYHAESQHGPPQGYKPGFLWASDFEDWKNGEGNFA